RELVVVVQLGANLVDRLDRDVLTPRAAWPLGRASPQPTRTVAGLTRTRAPAVGLPTLAVAHLQRPAAELRNRPDAVQHQRTQLFELAHAHCRVVLVHDASTLL